MMGDRILDNDTSSEWKPELKHNFGKQHMSETV